MTAPIYYQDTMRHRCYYSVLAPNTNPRVRDQVRMRVVQPLINFLHDMTVATIGEELK